MSSPSRVKKRCQFRDADLARARLILDLTNGVGVNEAGIDVIMDLVDQLHGLRMIMRATSSRLWATRLQR
nr:chaperone modulator CbpM [Rhizobium laguerreae]